ncbi:MAG: MFS transporter [Anaerolineales bacterium]|nr:MFS transporter [Anaerolineales bacterium]
MEKTMHLRDHIPINIHWLGLNVVTGAITPLLLPYFVSLFVLESEKNTYLATVRLFGLAVAMMVQPIAGMLSDRNTSRWGRRRPYIFGGTIANMIFILIMGASIFFRDTTLDEGLPILAGVSAAYLVLLLGLMLTQASANVTFGGLIGLIPDLVPENQRGRSSGIKAVMELLPLFLAVFIGPLVDQGRIWLVIGIVVISLFITMMITIIFVHEEPLKEKPKESLTEPILRIVALTVLFVTFTQAGVFLVRTSSNALVDFGADTTLQIILLGLAGLIAMAGSILLGVYFGAWVGIGRDARQQTSFIWWIINRLLFLAAVGSILGFILFYMRDYLRSENPATQTTILQAVVGILIIPAALGGGALADRVGRKRLVAYSGLVAALGIGVLLLARNFPVVVVSGCIIGLGSGVFMATNWALGTVLAPPEEAGRYLGIANLAGAGAGIVGAGIGGPMADFFNNLEQGLGYLVVFAIYGGLFLLSVAALTKIKTPIKEPSPP